MSKTALVTGASSGIGRAIALRLAADGHTVVAHYNSNKAGAEETLKLLNEKSPAGHKIIQFNACDFDQIEAAVKDISVDILINNAGLHKDGPSLLIENKNFENIVATNLFGPFYLSKLIGKKMLLKRSGIIVNVSSLAGQTGNPGQANYAASKAGLIALTKTMAMELGGRGIRVNAVAPGLIETEMISEVAGLEDMKKRIPMGRFGSATEVAGVVSFLCSADASYVTGQTISINGGMYCH